MKNYILFGPPGSGKGTQAEKLRDQYRLNHISTGDILRNEIKTGTALGLKAKKFMDDGLLVPDEVVIGMLGETIDAAMKKGGVTGFLFDGFPRTVEQAAALDRMLEQRKLTITRVLALEVSEEELTRRILKRGETSGRSDDQDPGIVRRRVQEYEAKTSPVAGYYGQQHKLASIKGEGSIADIFGRLKAEMDKA